MDQYHIIIECLCSSVTSLLIDATLTKIKNFKYIFKPFLNLKNIKTTNQNHYNFIIIIRN